VLKERYANGEAAVNGSAPQHSLEKTQTLTSTSVISVDFPFVQVLWKVGWI